MKIQDVALTIESINGTPEAILCTKAPYWDYKEGSRTTESPAGIRYTVSLPGNGLQQIDVKVPGVDTTPQLTADIIAAKLADLDFIKVTFPGSSVKFWRTKDGKDGSSASAKGITVCPDDTLDFGSGFGFGKEKK